MDVGFEEGLALFRYGMGKPFVLIAAAAEIREHFKGKRVNLCGIVNAKSGLCPEDCKFCAQSVHYCTDAPEYPFIGKEAIIEGARRAKAAGAHMFGIITSGTRVESKEEWNEIYGAVSEINKLGIKPCVSLGMLDIDRARRLKEAGLFRYHHNLETARSYFDNICTTHAYQEDIETVMAAKSAGLSTCSGGIIGMGETRGQRIEFAMTLKELAVDCIPFNILDPRPGTPLQDMEHISPIELLVTIAIFRFVLPDKDIKLCGGKETNLRQLLPLGIVAGCNSLMIGNYLTTPGRSPELDIEMVRDLGLDPVFE
ncbi:MAG: biotin synthase BioB [Deltaproteobacteria bacterium RBG_13_52_11]|nr:MAG: biotin synthase BioB [Deltaproteobacteria bacterium RBG_13_52_11]